MASMAAKNNARNSTHRANGMVQRRGMYGGDMIMAYLLTSNTVFGVLRRQQSVMAVVTIISRGRRLMAVKAKLK